VREFNSSVEGEHRDDVKRLSSIPELPKLSPEVDILSFVDVEENENLAHVLKCVGGTEKNVFAR
jgi:hypothetical protein